MIVELLQVMRVGQEVSCFKLKELQNSWYFCTLYEILFKTVVLHFSKAYLVIKYNMWVSLFMVPSLQKCSFIVSNKLVWKGSWWVILRVLGLVLGKNITIKIVPMSCGKYFFGEI